MQNTNIPRDRQNDRKVREERFKRKVRNCRISFWLSVLNAVVYCVMIKLSGDFWATMGWAFLASISFVWLVLSYLRLDKAKTWANFDAKVKPVTQKRKKVKK